MMGYWKNSELTAKALKGGWYHTGDLGYLDERGYLFLTARKSDMIISGGENVYPNEVENAVYTHPAVLECSVIAAPDERWGEIVHAVVVRRVGVRSARRDHRALPPDARRLQVPQEGDLSRQPAQNRHRQGQPQGGEGTAPVRKRHGQRSRHARMTRTGRAGAPGDLGRAAARPVT